MSEMPPPSDRKTKFCQYCGAEIDARAEICPKCGVRVAAPSPVVYEAGKTPVLALILSFLLPGLGQIYNGQAGKGVLMIFAAIVCAVLTLFIIGFFLYLIVWIYGMFDAYVTAEAYNRSRGLRPT